MGEVNQDATGGLQGSRVTRREFTRKASRLLAQGNEERDLSHVAAAELNLERAKAFRRLSPLESLLYAERARSALAGLSPVVTDDVQRRAERVRRELEKSQ